MCIYVAAKASSLGEEADDREFSIEFNGHENSQPLELRVCLSQTL